MRNSSTLLYSFRNHRISIDSDQGGKLSHRLPPPVCYGQPATAPSGLSYGHLLRFATRSPPRRLSSTHLRGYKDFPRPVLRSRPSSKRQVKSSKPRLLRGCAPPPLAVIRTSLAPCNALCPPPEASQVIAFLSRSATRPPHQVTASPRLSSTSSAVLKTSPATCYALSLPQPAINQGVASQRSVSPLLCDATFLFKGRRN